MAKFLDKKERVIDFNFTPYGKYLLSIGELKPVYYSFLDEGILYDSQYVGFSEPQNKIHERIKKETAFLESITNYGDPAERVNKYTTDGVDVIFEHNITPSMKAPDENIRQNVKIIGDANLEASSKNVYPSWKIVTLQGEIEDTTQVDALNSINIPQIYITASYVKKVVDPGGVENPGNIRQLMDTVGPFSDGTDIRLFMNDLIIYVEEANTQLLNENFEIEVYEVVDGQASFAASGGLNQIFERKYFRQPEPQIVDGYMVRNNYQSVINTMGDPFNIDTGSVGYYFNVINDNFVDSKLACKGANIFDKSSYYIDLDFDCNQNEDDTLVFADIYGEMTEPELCR